MIPIKYVGRRSRHPENLYGTGAVFGFGQVINFPDEIAAKLLKHSDVYQRADTAPADAPTVEVVEPKRGEQEEEAQNMDDLLRSVDNMDKDALERFAMTHFSIDLDKRKSVSALRQQVKTSIEQFGVV